MEKSLTVVEQKEVTFYNDELIAVRATDGHIYVSVRHMCDALGLSRQAQVRRINRNEILVEGYKGGAILAPPSVDGRGGGRQQAGMLRVDLVPLWLTGVSTNAVKEEIQPKLKKFQSEAAKVLWEAFQEGRLTADPTFDELLKTDSPAVQAYKTLQALTKIARSQIILEGRVDEHERRLEQIEATLGDPGHHVTPDQASQISQAVKAVAHAMGGHKSHYQGVYGELYRKFGITSYKQLPANAFLAAMDMLNNWHQDLTNKDIPF